MDSKRKLLDKYTNRLKEIEDSLSLSPSSSNSIKTLSKEYSHIKKIVELLNKYISLKDEQKETQNIINDKNSDDLKNFALEDNIRINKLLDETEKAINHYTNPNNKADLSNAIIEIRPGVGGEEASLFAFTLYKMYRNFAEKKSFKVINLDTTYTNLKGLKEVIFKVEGEAYGIFKFESGVHRVQRVPVTESSGRIHTSTVSVAVLPEIEDSSIEVLSSDIKIDVYRASGPGGQGVNTTDSAVRITHIPTGIVVTCQDSRSQMQNKENALSILKSRLNEIEEEKKIKEKSEFIKQQIGSSKRSEKIRTYNYPQDRITDHRNHKSWHNLNYIFEGNLEDIIESLENFYNNGDK